MTVSSLYDQDAAAWAEQQAEWPCSWPTSSALSLRASAWCGSTHPEPRSISDVDA